MNPDGLSYLDLASEASTGGPSELVNGLWSPGYPALISVALSLFRPSSSQEVPIIHLVNFFIFLFALGAFSLFFRYWSKAASGGDDAVCEKTHPFVTALAFGTFLWFTLTLIGVEVISPDLGAAAFVFLAAGISCRLSLPGASWAHYAALGLVLGAGYYFKAALFPLGMALLALLFFLLPLSSGLARRKLFLSLCLSLAVFLLVAAPLVAALSVRADRLTFGEAGRLNYVWHVNHLLWTGGYDQPDPDTTAEHPAPRLLGAPLTLEFASPVKGTYPLWYDPSYWYAGVAARFDFHQQIAAFIHALQAYKDIALGTMPFIAGALVLWVANRRMKLHPTAARSSWWQIAWPLAACSLFALVHVEARYVCPFLVLFWLAIYRALMSRENRTIAAVVSATVLCTVLIPFTERLAVVGGRTAKALVHPTAVEYQTAANALRELGLQNGDRLAVLGYAYDCYYARCARLRVVAQIPDTHEFCHLSAPELQTVTHGLPLLA